MYLQITFTDRFQTTKLLHITINTCINVSSGCGHSSNISSSTLSWDDLVFFSVKWLDLFSYRADGLHGRNRKKEYVCHRWPYNSLQGTACVQLQSLATMGKHKVLPRSGIDKHMTMLIEVHFCGHQQAPNDNAPVSTLNLATIGKGGSRLHSRPTWTKHHFTCVDHLWSSQYRVSTSSLWTSLCCDPMSLNKVTTGTKHAFPLHYESKYFLSKSKGPGPDTTLHIALQYLLSGHW